MTRHSARCLAAVLGAAILASPCWLMASETVYFRRGDANTDLRYDISDGIFTLGFLFTGGPEPQCKRAADSNDDGRLDLSDAIYSFSHLFTGGPPPPPPGFTCGFDPTPDRLFCLSYPFCRQPIVSFEVIDGFAVIEEDIVIGRAEDIPFAIGVGREEGGAAGFLTERLGDRWPNNTVPFTIDPMLPNPQRVTDAIQHWEDNTRFRFIERTPANQNMFPDFIAFQVATGCFSPVGRRGGLQMIGLAAGCGRGAVIHEIGHSIGLWHEQSRPDRDSFITVLCDNITPAMKYNFDVQPGTICTPYDYGSIMHYGTFAFSANNMPTIETIPPGIPIGQRNGLSPGDLLAVERFYDIGSLLALEGKVTLLRVHDVGTGFGPPGDRLDVEVVLRLDTRPDESFGFQLRDDGNEAARRGMLDLARDSFVKDRRVRIEFTRSGCRSGRIIRMIQLP
jgi:hypothetical protein